MGNKIRVVVIPSDNGGCRTWRMTWPHLKLDSLYGDEFDVVINDNPDWNNPEYFKDFDIVTFHKGTFFNREGFLNCLKYCKENHIITIMDVDDYWDLGPNHPMFIQSTALKNPQKIVENLRLVDYVTTTTEIFAEQIRKYNKNVFIFPNAIDTEDKQWAPDYSRTDKIRFGFVMGSTHERDLEQFRGTIEKLPADVLEKIQIVLCGFDIRGNATVMDKNKNIIGTRPIRPEESVWTRYEKLVTADYRFCDGNYKNFLLKFLPNSTYPNVEHEFYRREWTKNLNTFGTHYNNIDILLVPLAKTEFNKYKSELKIVESGFKHKGVIVSDFGPYTIGTKSIFKKGGEIDPTGNCVLIDPVNAHKEWGKAITKIVRNPELVDLLQNNNYNHVKDEYNLDNVTKIRAEWYHKITGK